MPRPGSTLQFQLPAHLVERAGVGARVECVRRHAFPRLRDECGRSSAWKVLKTHVCTGEMRAEFLADNARGVYVFRDVRDVVVSAMRKRAERFDQLGGEGYV